ncbi:p53 and DNA damage-regulated protein 1-like [Paramacrobiotus metropolitanus]|uniref:p53 and DNA damage-regulated protein 1-like n=1 Tax=Paramacrobiotus metropolitanus TaxID=2943436 RepID=UPI0024462281|nr:p53 and DNA damage-regulated protein 1-like [Paramacrobiotus metropolitanus]
MDKLTTDELLKSLFDVEKLGDEIIADRHRIVDMDRIRNKNREALGQLKRPSELTSREQHVWMNIGDMFIRTSKTNLVTILEEDQKYLDSEISTIRTKLKPKVFEISRSLGKPEMKGFDLQPLTKEEMDGVRQIAGLPPT